LKNTKTNNKLESIFKATVTLTANVGIAGLKMSAIAEEAQMATGTLYLYFKNKNVLLNAVYNELKTQGIVATIGKIEHLPIHVQLYKLWEIAFDYHVSNHTKSLFMEQFELSSIISEENKALEENAGNFLDATLNTAKEKGIIKDIDNHLINSLILGFLKDVSLKVSKGIINKDEKLKDVAYSMCWDAIKKNE